MNRKAKRDIYIAALILAVVCLVMILFGTG
jgi:hypothetical protein